MHGRRDEAQCDRDPPHGVVVALQVEQQAAAPAADEAADLMAEEDDAVQHGDVHRPEDVADQRGGQRHGAQPQEAERAREDQHRGGLVWPRDAWSGLG